jgi:hypothetical protein
MDISTKRQIPQDIYNFIKILKFNNEKINLMGTAGLASQRYYSDYDLFVQITGRISVSKVYDKLMDILRKSQLINDMYFIELKIQRKDGSKTKFRKIQDITKGAFRKAFINVDFIKLDFVVRVKNIFTELSIIYSFNKLQNEDEYIKSLVKDANELKKKGSYYKLLKRIFSIYNSKYVSSKLKEENKDKYIMLSDFFNSEYGKLYQDTASLKAIKLLLENYDDKMTLDKVLINLKDLKVKPSIKDIDKYIGKNEKKYNKIALKMLKKI